MICIININFQSSSFSQHIILCSCVVASRASGLVESISAKKDISLRILSKINKKNNHKRALEENKIITRDFSDLISDSMATSYTEINVFISGSINRIAIPSLRKFIWENKMVKMSKNENSHLRNKARNNSSRQS